MELLCRIRKDIFVLEANMEQLAELTKALALSIQEQTKMTQQFLAQQQQQQQIQQQQLQQQLQQQQERTQKTLEAQQEQTNILQRQMSTQQKNLEKLILTSTGKKTNFSAEGISNSLTEFRYSPDTGVTFPAYYRRYETIFTKRCLDWTDEEKVTLLLQKLGTDENTKYANLILPKKPEEVSFEETISTLSKIFDKRDSLFHSRYKCLNIQKAEAEDYLEYACTVNCLCESFKLNEISADQFKCLIFVQGLTAPRDKDIRSRILTIMEADPNITLQKVTEECQRLINIKKDNTRIEEKNIFKVQQVKRQGTTRKSRFQEHRILKGYKDPKLKCKCCGSLRHNNKTCWFRNKICYECGLRGHKGTYCAQKKRQGTDNVNTLRMNKEKSCERRKYVDVRINGHLVTLLLDSGADISIINEDIWKRIGRPELTKTRKTARSVCGKRLEFKGELKCKVTFANQTHKSKVYVVPGKNTCLFGVDWIVLFNLWEKPINSFCNVLTAEKANQREDFLKDLKTEFPNVFAEGLGLCIKTEAKFELKKNATPVFKPKRNVPFSAMDAIEKELDRLQQLEVIEKVNHTDWASPTVYVKKKNNRIRVCGDFSTGLNDCLLDHNYPLPSAEDLFSKLNGGKIFSKIDLSDAYLQIKISDECSKYLGINTHKGIFKLKRLPFGLKVAPAIFQQIMDTMLAGLEFSMAYLDDILIKSENLQDHKKHVKEVFKRIQEFGFKLSPEKCDFFMKKIKYLGQIIDKEGRRPDPQRTEAIEKMPAPDSVTKLKSFLGLVQYYAIYIPNIHNLRAPLNELLKKGVKWNWNKECESAFQNIKRCLLSDLALAHFNPEKELILATDASDYGVGAVLLHKYEDGRTKAIAHASRTLVAAEKNYSQIEKEALSIIFGITKYNRFLHGRSFILQTDHKPLLTIFGSKKGIPTHTANRLQRWAVTLLNYQFKMEHVSSKKLGHADALSRLIPKRSESFEETVIAALKDESECTSSMCNMIRELPVTFEKIKKEAVNDIFIKKMKNQLGWIKKNKKVDQTTPFSICEDVLMYGERIVIPLTLQRKILKEFHTGHPGISRMKSLMRGYVYWPGMDKEVEKCVKTCRGCQLAARDPPVKTTPWPKTDLPWSRLHIDYAGPINGYFYLIIVDSFSKWPEIFKFRHPTAKNTVSALNEIFSRFGVPKTLVSDNGTAFTAHEFKEFCDSLNILHMTTPVYHPRSNGLAEKFVDTFKRALKKNLTTDTDEQCIQTFLAIYRVTPNPNNNVNSSPAELMFARKIRSVFDRLLPEKKKVFKKENLNTKCFSPGENVYFKNFQNGRNQWVEGIIKKRIGSMVYTIQGLSFVCKRHRNQIRPRLSPNVEETPMETLCDIFDIPKPACVPQTMNISPEPTIRAGQKPLPRVTLTRRKSARKRKVTRRLSPDPKRKRYLS